MARKPNAKKSPAGKKTPRMAAARRAKPPASKAGRQAAVAHMRAPPPNASAYGGAEEAERLGRDLMTYIVVFSAVGADERAKAMAAAGVRAALGAKACLAKIIMRAKGYGGDIADGTDAEDWGYYRQNIAEVKKIYEPACAYARLVMHKSQEAEDVRAAIIRLYSEGGSAARLSALASEVISGIPMEDAPWCRKKLGEIAAKYGVLGGTVSGK